MEQGATYPLRVLAAMLLVSSSTHVLLTRVGVEPCMDWLRWLSCLACAAGLDSIASGSLDLRFPYPRRPPPCPLARALGPYMNNLPRCPAHFFFVSSTLREAPSDDLLYLLGASGSSGRRHRTAESRGYHSFVGGRPWPGCRCLNRGRPPGGIHCIDGRSAPGGNSGSDCWSSAE